MKKKRKKRKTGLDEHEACLTSAYFIYDNVYKVPEKSKYYLYIYIYNKYVIREEFSFSSISFALSLHQFTKREKKEKKKKKKKRYEQK